MVKCADILIQDPVTGAQIRALRLDTGHTALTVIPERSLDIYELSSCGRWVSYTNRSAKITGEGFREAGPEGFSAHFFAGMLTTCGLIQAGRPCEENGRRFGLHGCISNTPAASVTVCMQEDRVELRGIIEERHPEGEALRLTRTIILDSTERLQIRDTVENIGAEDTPFMLMYHVNFGAPFLSEQLRVSIPFTCIEDRDTGLPALPEEVCRMEPEGAWLREKVYYTRADMETGALLSDPVSGLDCRMTAEGTAWLGIWKNFVRGAYALGIEPCLCPGLGRVNAAKRGLLPRLAPGESHSSGICLQFMNNNTKTEV